MKKTFLAGLILLSLSAFAQKAPSHKQWDALLKKYVNKEGLVNYKGLKKDKEELDSYLKLLSNNGPKTGWSDNDEKAFWINAYNAFTVSLIVKNYPVKSIKDLGGSLYKINTVWDKKFITINGEKLDLNNIEHGKLRRRFNDARIHFAVNCASMSCPPLRNEAYTGDKIDEQLNDAGRKFLADKSKNKITKEKAELSKLFSWYSGDFKKGGSLISFLNKYSPVKLSDDTKIDYMSYDWGLNEQK